jgi:type I restriction enzyme S subunit
MRAKGGSLLRQDYLHHLVRWEKFTAHSVKTSRGAKMPRGDKEALRQFEFALPEPAKQQAIAAILGSIDAKIDVSRRLNQTLEATARRIFNDWFVDYGPTRAKLDGAAPYLEKSLWELFPNELDGQGLPLGWRMTSLQEVLATLETGGRPRGGVASYTTGVPSIGAESVVGIGIFDFSKTKYVPEQYFLAMRRGHVEDGDVLLYKDGGKPGLFEPHATLVGDGFPFPVSAINEHVYRVRAEPEFGQAMLYFWLTSDRILQEMRVKGTGVAVPGLNSTQVKSLTTLLPSRELLRRFDGIAKPLIDRIFLECNAARVLAQIRDLLLPRLMSGEIRLKDAERVLEAAE